MISLRQRLASLTDEGLRLFFPLSALHVALWPLFWVVAQGFSLPLAKTLPSGLWHAHEMIYGAYGAALLGFLTTAMPEWTDTPRPRGRTLLMLAALWLPGRIIGVLGWELALPLAALCDALWLGWLIVFALGISWAKRTDRLLAFVFWLAGLLAAELVARYAMMSGAVELASLSLRLAGFAFLGLLGLALARITPPITNQVLDPSEATTPFRPHPGRLNLAPGLVAVMVAGELAGLSPAVRGWLTLAAGAAFLDRVAEGFIGRESLRAEILALAGSSALTGAGLLMLGAAQLGAPFSETSALHLILMGGLGLGVLGVFALAGLLHTGQPLGLSRSTKFAVALLLLGTALRLAPDLGVSLTGGVHVLASMVWASAFLLWAWDYVPALSDPTGMGKDQCG